MNEEQKLDFYGSLSFLDSLENVYDFLADFLEKHTSFGSLVFYTLHEPDILSLDKIKLPSRYETLARQYHQSKIEIKNHALLLEVLEKNMPLILDQKELGKRKNPLKNRLEFWQLKEELTWVVLLPISDGVDKPIGVLLLNSDSGEHNALLVCEFAAQILKMSYRRLKAEWKILGFEYKKQQLDVQGYKNSRMLGLASELNTLQSVTEILGFLLDEFLTIFSFDMGLILLEERGRLVEKKIRVKDPIYAPLATKEMTIYGEWEHGYNILDNDNPEGAVSMSYLDNRSYYLADARELLAGGVILNPKDARALEILDYKLVTILHVPIRDSGKPIGTLQLRSLEQKVLLSPEDIKLLEDLCSFLPSILRNASLHERIIHQEQALVSMNETLKNQNLIITHRQGQIDKDLKLAQRIQLQLLPRNYPDMAGIQIAHVYKPLEEIGGDFFDYLRYKEPHLVGFFISDVSGHGVSAALITSMLKALIESSGVNRLDPDRMFEFINLKLHNHIGGNFLTAFYAIYNTLSRELIYTRAAHPFPYIIRRGELIALDGKGSTILGMLTDLPFFVHRVQLEPGDKLFFYTDGLTEAVDSDYVEFGDYLEDLLVQHSEFSVQEMIQIIYNALLDHCEERDFEDDVCMFCVQI